MTGIIKVSPERLIQASSEFSSQGTNIANLTSEMVNLATSLSSAWEGEASNAYINKFKSLESDIQVLIRMIQEHTNDLQQMAELYISTENANIDDASALASGIIS